MKFMPAHKPVFNRLFPVVFSASLLLPALALLVSPGAAAEPTNLLIKGDGPAVYYLSEQNRRYVFPNEHIFKSWYQDFTGVQTVTPTALAGYQIGGNVKYRPGTRLVKIVSDPTVYGVGMGGTLHGLASETAAAALYGAAWANRVDDLPDAFFFDYTIAEPLDGTAHPTGTLFKFSGQSTYRLLLANDAGALESRSISSSLLSAWHYQTTNALTISPTLFPYTAGTALSSADVALSYAHQPASGISAPIPPAEPPAPSPATLTAASGTSNTASLIAVLNDESALFYQVKLTGDAKHDMRLTSLSATFYIDAGGIDKDFVAGMDEDGTVIWPVNQVLRDARLINADTGEVLDTVNMIEGSGRVTFHPTLDMPAKSVSNLNIVTLVSSLPVNARVSVDIIPSSDITATSSTASSLSIVPTTKLNGGTSPAIIVALKSFGKLQIKSTNLIDNRLLALSAPYDPLKLTFISAGEPFIVKRLSFTTTTEGSAYLAAADLRLSYINSTGAATIASVDQIENGRFHFINLDIAVPKNTTVDVPVTVESDNRPQVFSGKRLQLSFYTDTFEARTGYSELYYGSSDFTNAQKLVNSASAGPLIIYRESTVAFSAHPDSPKSPVTRFSDSTTLTFNVTGETGTVGLHRLTFKIETNDINVTGDDNDLLERYANLNPFDFARLYGHKADRDDRVRIVPHTTTFAIYDKSSALLDTTPDGLQTGSGDYGIVVMEFGGSPIELSAGQIAAFDFDLDTTMVSAGETYTIRSRLLGDSKLAAVSEANFLWNDGSDITTTGYLVEGLELSGSILGIN